MKTLAQGGRTSRIDVPGMPLSRVHSVALVIVPTALLVCPSSAWCGETRSATVAVRADFAPRTSLKVSTHTLRFEPGGAEELPVAEVEFSAAARTRTGGEVLLTAELSDAGCPDQGSVTVTGSGPGVVATLTVGTPIPVARWIGSGVRTGRLTFTAPPCTVPVRFVLSTP